ncbi:MAG: hypothetical protein IJW97_04620 [Clostridia bacterium]|nr:hypothetical protein [Clostridia bacterium]
MNVYLLRCLCLLAVALLLVGCNPGAAEPAEPSPVAAAISLLCEKTDMSEASAVDVLAHMHRAGLSTEIRMAFPAESREGAPIYRIWTPDSAVDVALDEQGLVVLLQNGDEVYYSAPPKPVTPTDEPSVPDQAGNNTSDAAQDVPNSGNDGDNDNNDNIPAPTPSGSPDGESSDQGDATETKLRVLSLTSPIAAGKQATLKAVGLPNTEYAISVRYASGESTAKGLENATTDAQGNVSWTFRVASRVAAGRYPVTVTGGGESVSVILTVLD